MATVSCFPHNVKEQMEKICFVKMDDETPAELLITLPGAQRPAQWPSDTLIVFHWGPPPVDLWMLDLSDPDSPRAEAYLEQEADHSET